MKRIVFALLFFILPAVMSAQTARTVAQESLRRSLGQSLRPVDVVITGERLEPNGAIVPFRAVIQGTRKVRYEIGTGRQMQVSIFNENSAWFGAGGTFRKMPQQAPGSHRPALIPFLDLLSEADYPATLVSDGSLRQLGASSVIRVQIRVPDPAPERRIRKVPLDEQANVYIDPNTYLVVRTERILISDTDLDFRVPAATEYSDYRNVQGFAVPFRVVDVIGTPQLGIRQTVITIQTVAFNQGVPDSAFQPQ